jgi:hypothetical protein
MKTIVRADIQPIDVENYINNLLELYDVIHLSHSTYYIDINPFFSIIAVVGEEKVQPFEVALAIEHYATCKHR